MEGEEGTGGQGDFYQRYMAEYGDALEKKHELSPPVSEGRSKRSQKGAKARKEDVAHRRETNELNENTKDMLEVSEDPRATTSTPVSGIQSRSEPFIHPSRRQGGQVDKQSEAVPQQEPKASKKRPRLSEDEIEQKRQHREKDKKAWGKKTKTGQPDMVNLGT